ncbi:MAG TPA: hypothetical protein VN699_13010 [Pirellulales bacterium]|nr:hypothetical protein [Pirellulales bacterium]
MIEPTLLSDSVVPADYIAKAIKATSSTDINGLLSELPVVLDDDYAFNEEAPEQGQRELYAEWAIRSLTMLSWRESPNPLCEVAACGLA